MRYAIVLPFVIAAAAACSNTRAHCAKEQECDQKDNADTDFVDVCSAQFDGLLNGLRANKENECKQLADAFDAVDGCEAQLSCSDLAKIDDGGKCDEERTARNDACKAISDKNVDCESLLQLSCGIAELPQPNSGAACTTTDQCQATDSGAAAACASDSDCDASAGEQCLDGADDLAHCVVVEQPGDGPCSDFGATIVDATGSDVDGSSVHFCADGSISCNGGTCSDGSSA